MLKKQQSCFISATLKSWSGRKLLDPTTYVSYFKEHLGSLTVQTSVVVRFESWLT